MAKHHERTDARKQAVQILYTCEIQNKNSQVLLDTGCCLIGDFPENEQGKAVAMKAPVLLDYALALVSGVEQYHDSLDHELESTSENWAVSRMPIVDRCILRLSTYEMLYVDDVPISVSINEAVELAKDFGGEDDSPRFVNGVLGCIAKRIEARKEEASVIDNAECETDV